MKRPLLRSNFSRSSAVPAGVRSSSRLIAINGWLVLAFYLAYYFEISIVYNDVALFPFFGCVCVALLIWIFNRHRLQSADVSALGVIFMIYLLSAALHFGDTEEVTRRLSSLANGCLVLLLGYCWCMALTSLSSNRIARLALGISIFITAYALLEQLEAFRQLSDAVRALIYPRGVYDQDTRDIALYGAVRPKVFLREPSLVGINLGLALSVWLLVRRPIGLIRLFVVIAWLGGAVFVIRSPTLAIFAAICIFGYLAYSLPRQDIVNVVGGIAVIAVFMLPGLSLIASELFGGVIERIVSGWSFYLRQIGPYKIAQSMLIEDPLFGYGIGASQVLLSEVQSTYASLSVVAGMKDFDQSVSVRPELFITNAFWQFWIVFGVAMGALLILAFSRLLKVLHVSSATFILVSFCLASQTLGGITGIWVAFILFTYISVDVVRGT